MSTPSPLPVSDSHPTPPPHADERLLKEVQEELRSNPSSEIARFVARSAKAKAQ